MEAPHGINISMASSIEGERRREKRERKEGREKKQREREREIERVRERGRKTGDSIPTIDNIEILAYWNFLIH